MGKVVSKLTRPVKNFNVENRAQRILQSEKPRPAPRHPSTAAVLEQEAKEHPEFLTEQKMKHGKLDEYLKQVRVDSKGDNPEIRAKTDRHLPEDRRKIDPGEFGIPEPDRIPEGKASLRQALDFISQHYLDPATHNAPTIAAQYKLDPAKVSDVLTYFQTLHMHIPEEMLKKNPKLLQSFDSRPTQPKRLTQAEKANRLGPGGGGGGGVNLDPQRKN